ncbi:MAG: 5-methyltetrahydropteroyltriglutamate--homocysteine S-methyltransferase [Ktedonobacteraceae bacterium]
MTTVHSRDLGRMRVDQVGSLLRPPSLKEAFVKHEQGLLDDAALRAAQDEAIRAVVARQESHHLPIVTDGEYRRINCMASFAEVAGYELWKSHWEPLPSPEEKALATRVEQRQARESSGGRGRDPMHSVRQPATQRLRLLRNRPLEEFQFTQHLTHTPAKVTLIGPDRIIQRFASEQSQEVYASVEEFVADVVAIERQMIAALAQAGCHYIQMDEPGYTAYIDEREQTEMRTRGEDPIANMERSMQAGNEVIANFPDVTFGVHICRGNRRSYWLREGTYDAIAERLFNSLEHQRFLLEYDTERAGGFAPLRFVPKKKCVVLGLITTKTGRLETVDELTRRIEEAAHYISIEQLALSPQCGFASELGGNLLSEEEQWRKLDIMLETAARIWGS